MKRGSTYIHIFPAAIITIGIVASVVSISLSDFGSDFSGLLLLVSAATLLVGGVLGFLFGIPKLNKAYDPREDYERSTKYHPNTNLEDVSDWLTKIIVGVALTQLTRIPGYLQGISDGILRHVDCSQMNCNFAQPVLVASIIYFLIAGFIIGYFYTRLYLPNLFSIMEEARVKDAEITIWRTGVKKLETEGSPSSETNTKASSNLSSLSHEERRVLKMIKHHGNQLPPLNTLTINEQAAVNVLVAKGILQWEPNKDPRERDIPRIGNQEFLDTLDDTTM